MSSTSSKDERYHPVTTTASSNLVDLPSATFGQRCKVVLNLAVPTSAYNLIQIMLGFLNLLYVGSLND